MLTLTSSVYGSIVCGRVLKTKPGSGSAFDKLTIVTITDVSTNGAPLGESIKILFWNSEKGSKLSDKARKLIPGELISARVVFDVGLPDKAIGYELKKSGLYTLTLDSAEESYVLHGKVSKVVTGKDYLGVYVPIMRFVDNQRVTLWYLATFWNDTAKHFANSLKKGDTVFIRGYAKAERTYNNWNYIELKASYVKTIHDTI